MSDSTPATFARIAIITAILASVPVLAAGQPAAPYQPVTPSERVDWIVDGTVGPRSLCVVGIMGASFQTAVNTPSEWERSWSGFGKRYLQREADVAISNTLEAGVGALWGEEPRYIRSGRGKIGERARYAVKTAFLAQHADGLLYPAWGRYVGNTVNNLIENAWLPPSVTTPGQTALRSILGFLTRMGGNAFEEFWPDVRRYLKK
jgi:hypothetical protein